MSAKATVSSESSAGGTPMVVSRIQVFTGLDSSSLLAGASLSPSPQGYLHREACSMAAGFPPSEKHEKTRVIEAVSL